MIRTLALALCAAAIAHAAAAHDLSRAPSTAIRVLPPQTLQSIDLGKEIPGQAGRAMRMRRMILEPGGAIPAHGHADRPAMFYILEGTLREHRSDRAAPLIYGPGDSMAEGAAVHHWVENIGNGPLIGLVIDLPNDGRAPAYSEDTILQLNGMPRHDHD